jgi:hypothetical protein
LKKLSASAATRPSLRGSGETAKVATDATGEAKSSSVASALKEQLALLSFLVLFAGIVATETYYTAFGVRYQILDLGLPHLIYRGVTAVLHSAVLGLAYAIAILWLAVGADYVAARGRYAARLAPLGTYAVIVGVVAASYFAAIESGRRSALQDQSAAASLLPTIRAIQSSTGAALPFQGFRLLAAGKDTVLIFKPVSSDAEAPFIHVFRRDQIGEITLSR